MLKAIMKIKQKRQQLDNEQHEQKQSKWERYRRLLALENPTENEADDLVALAAELGFDDKHIEVHAAAVDVFNKAQQFLDEHANINETRKEREAALEAVSEKIEELRGRQWELNRSIRECYNLRDRTYAKERNQLKIKKAFPELFDYHERKTPVTSQAYRNLPKGLNRLAAANGLIEELAPGEREKNERSVNRDFEHRRAEVAESE